MNRLMLTVGAILVVSLAAAAQSRAQRFNIGTPATPVDG